MEITKSTNFINRYFTSIFSFIFFGLGLIVHDGFVYGAALLLLAALPSLFKKESYSRLNKYDLILIATFLAFCGVWMVNNAYNLLSLRTYDDPLRFIAAIIALLLLIKYPPKENYIWAGVCIGAIGTGSWAIWEKFYLGASRVSGHTNAIQYGNLSILMGVLCFIGIAWAVNLQKLKNIWMFFLGIGFCFGILASGLSGSRGGWVGLAFILIYIFTHFHGIWSKKILSILGIVFLGAIAALYLTPETGIKKRIDQVGHDLHLYSQGKTLTSVGTRLELWRGSLILIKERPLWGWGESAYLEQLQNLSKGKIIAPAIISHPHNDFLNAGSKRGIIGIISLLALYLVPIYLFRKLKQDIGKTEPLALYLSVPIIAISYIDFGLTQAFFSHNNGVMFYAFSIVIFYSALRPKIKAPSIQRAS